MLSINGNDIYIDIKTKYDKFTNIIMEDDNNNLIFCYLSTTPNDLKIDKIEYKIKKLTKDIYVELDHIWPNFDMININDNIFLIKIDYIIYNKKKYNFVPILEDNFNLFFHVINFFQSEYFLNDISNCRNIPSIYYIFKKMHEINDLSAIFYSSLVIYNPELTSIGEKLFKFDNYKENDFIRFKPKIFPYKKINKFITYDILTGDILSNFSFNKSNLSLKTMKIIISVKQLLRYFEFSNKLRFINIDLNNFIIYRTNYDQLKYIKYKMIQPIIRQTNNDDKTYDIISNKLFTCIYNYTSMDEIINTYIDEFNNLYFVPSEKVNDLKKYDGKKIILNNLEFNVKKMGKKNIPIIYTKKNNLSILIIYGIIYKSIWKL